MCPSPPRSLGMLRQGAAAGTAPWVTHLLGDTVGAQASSERGIYVEPFLPSLCDASPRGAAPVLLSAGWFHAAPRLPKPDVPCWDRAGRAAERGCWKIPVRWPAARGEAPSTAGAAPTARSPIAEQAEPPPLQSGCPHPRWVAGGHPLLPRCCQHPRLAAGTHPPRPGRPRAGQLAVPQPSPHRLSPQGFVLGGLSDASMPWLCFRVPFADQLQPPRAWRGPGGSPRSDGPREGNKVKARGEGVPRQGSPRAPPSAPQLGAALRTQRGLLRPQGLTGRTVPGRQGCSASVSPQRRCTVPASPHQPQPRTRH